MNDSYVRGFLIGKEIMNMFVPKKQQPIAYLYNGVRLPTLPEWDRERYPYAFMFGYYSLGAGYAYDLYVSEEIVYSGKNIGVGSASIRFSCYPNALNPSEKWISGTAFSGMICSRTEVMWANFDVLNQDGTVFLAASNPIPIYNEPVNYLYNGVKLPKLPEWDKTVYPYAFLRNIDIAAFSDNMTRIRLAVCSECPISDALMTAAAGSVAVYDCYLTEEAASEAGYNAGEWVFQNIDATHGINMQIGWVNFDLYNKDGELFLEESEPVPVYE